MASRTHPRLSAPRVRQHGQVLLVVLLLIGLAVTVFVYGMVDPTLRSAKREAKTHAELAQAKQALIGRAVSDNNRPGSLPCPDIDNDGVLTLNVDYLSGGVCASNMGRLPWRTLGLPDLRDSGGERLWYALSGNFQDATGSVINSDTKGQLTVTGVAPANEVVAILFAPGPAVSAQVRGTAIEQNNVANYLEGGNQDGDNTFTTALAGDSFNDRLLVITTADLMTPVELRAAREVLSLLLAYRAGSACGCYPWADKDIPWTGEGDNDGIRGGIDFTEGDPEFWGSGAIPPVPAWLLNNQWWRVIYYAVAPSETQYHTAGTLTVDGVPGTLVVLITTGPAGASRPSWNWANYLDDPENADHSNNVYVRPSSSAYARDRLYTIP